MGYPKYSKRGSGNSASSILRSTFDGVSGIISSVNQFIPSIIPAIGQAIAIIGQAIPIPNARVGEGLPSPNLARAVPPRITNLAAVDQNKRKKSTRKRRKN